VIHIGVLVAALLIAVVAEVVGVVRTKRQKTDTYTELVRWVGNRSGPWAFPIGIFLIGLLVWAIPHLWLALVDGW
jgi:hypothetical protein